jgi:cytochrome bd ubiquinol oxidase subunit I
MTDNIDLSLVDWSRAQFALTAIYHWIFVPLTIGLSLILAIMESIYVKTGNEEWRRITRFWMKLFGINFAIGIATGLILEFEFGTNWSSYSWFVGDIFGAPLAIEGILAFFLESTFIAVMFFGWNKVSKRFHLISTWLVAIGAMISALWILVANAWMQHPVGMTFNPATARNEMLSFWAVLFNQMAVDKFLHTVTSGFLLASMFVLAVSSWFLIKKREEYMATRSMLVASVIGLLSSLMVAYTGDESAKNVAKMQPVKFASMEALFNGKSNAGLVAVGILKNTDKELGNQMVKEFAFKIEIPGLMSYLTGGDNDAYVPGLNDHLWGNEAMGIIPTAEKMKSGRHALEVLNEYKKARKDNDTVRVAELSALFRDKEFNDKYFKYFGYSSISRPEDVVPNVATAFYSFHLMVILGFFFIMIFSVALILLYRGVLTKSKWFLWIGLLSLPLPFVSSELGWIVAEVGRQPWIIQDLLTVNNAVTRVTTGSVITTFILFAVMFTALLIAEVSIMLKQIKTGANQH